MLLRKEPLNHNTTSNYILNKPLEKFLLLQLLLKKD